MSPPAPLGSAARFLSLTVAGPASAADLSLPADVPVAELLPDLVRLLSPDPEVALGTGWGLNRLGEAPLSLDRGLTAAGVRDGDMVYLRPLDEIQPATVADLVDAVAGAVDVRGGLWTAAARRSAMTLAAAVALLLATAVAVHDLPLGVRVGVALGIALLAVAAARLAAPRAGTLSAALLALSAVVPAGLAGGIAGALLDPAGFAGVVAGTAVGVAAGAGAAALAVPAARGPAAAVAVAAVPAGAVVAIGMALGASAGQVAAVLAVLLVCAAAQLPLLVAALHLGGAATAREAGLAEQEVAARVDSAHHLLGWLSAGTSAALAGALAVLALSTEPWELALAGTAALAAALGSRRQRFLEQGLPPLIAALAGLLCLELGLAVRIGGDAASGIGLALLLSTSVLLLTLVLAGGRSGSSALLRSRLRRLESLALVALVPLAMGALGVYAAIGDLGRRLG
ncbi:MAG TPA: type VII secretion integral membrane protein EccD [Candidatus Dormibacteraeota bacterium]|nr:type VII secretion integral membrane protein EccD [Candidatus Dormibacteraeota bacterium]